MPEVYIIKWF